jgi:hypothetical protein
MTIDSPVACRRFLPLLAVVAMFVADDLHAQGTTGTGSAPSGDTAGSVSGATGGAAPGGVFIRTRAPSLGPARNVHFDAATNSIKSDQWTFPLQVSIAEVKEIFDLAAKQDFLAVDITTRSDAQLFGLSRDGKVAKQMLVTDLLLGDIAKGYGYFAPLYKTAGDFKPQRYNLLSRQQFAVIFVFMSAGWRIDGSRLLSESAKLEVLGVPTLAQRDGTRRFDLDAMKREVRDASITENARHIMENEAYYRQERVVRDMQAYADIAQLARELLKQNVDLAGLFGGQ